MTPTDDAFEADLAPGPSAEAGGLVVSLEGYEGPLDLLLDLARKQKVDLAKISILNLAEQYLAFVAAARRVRLDLAADYLVMAAWLAFLKSRLLLPPEQQPSDEPTGEEMAELLQQRLRILESMRDAGTRLLGRPRLGLSVFSRGAPEDVRTITTPIWQLSLYELLRTYAEFKVRTTDVPLQIRPIQRFTVEDALRRLVDLLGGGALDWATLETFLPSEIREGPLYRNAVATTLVASLELARSGRIDLRQPQAFGPIYIRRAEDGAESKE